MGANWVAVGDGTNLAGLLAGTVSGVLRGVDRTKVGLAFGVEEQADARSNVPIQKNCFIKDVL